MMTNILRSFWKVKENGSKVVRCIEKIFELTVMNKFVLNIEGIECNRYFGYIRFKENIICSWN